MVRISPYQALRWKKVTFQCSVLSCFTLRNVGRVSAFDEAHTTNIILDTLAILGAVSDAGALFLIIILSCRWSQFIFRERKKK